jgi:hypothetical protein
VGTVARPSARVSRSREMGSDGPLAATDQPLTGGGCSSYGEKFAIEFVSGWAFRTGRGVPVMMTSGKLADSSACPP